MDKILSFIFSLAGQGCVLYSDVLRYLSDTVLSSLKVILLIKHLSVNSCS